MMFCVSGEREMETDEAGASKDISVSAKDIKNVSTLTHDQIISTIK